MLTSIHQLTFRVLLHNESYNTNVEIPKDNKP